MHLIWDFFGRISASIRFKLFAGTMGITVFALFFASVFSIVPLTELKSSLIKIGGGNLKSLLCISTIKEAQSQMMSAERTLLIRQLSDQNIRRENYDIIESSYRAADAAAGEFDRLELTPAQLESWRLFRAAWDVWSAKQNELLDILHKQEELLSQGIRGGRQFDRIANQAFDLAFSDLRTLRNDANQHLDRLVDAIQRNAVDAVNQSVESVDNSIAFQIIILFLALVLSVIGGFVLSSKISRPILQGVTYITQVADGNLRHDVDPGLLNQRGELGLLLNAIQKLIESQRREVAVFKSIANGDYTSTVELRSNQDELGMSVTRMLDITNETLVKVNVAVTKVTHGAGAINSASQTLSQGALETAASLEEISASIAQIGEKTRANASSADEADKLAASSQTAVGKGYEAVAELIQAMKDIQVISAQIAAVVKLIDDIAFQTNLLALNAAVEAARAGRHGRGFSIVADEVRSLAGRSAKAAKDTAQMLEKTVDKLDKGSVLAEHTDSVLREIVDNAAKTAGLFREIAKSSNEQSLGIGQVANGLSQIDRVTQHNTLTASETASAAISLLRQAEGLRTQMQQFRLRGTIGGGGKEMLMRKNPRAGAERPRMDNDPGPSSGPERPGALPQRRNSINLLDI